MDTARQEQQLRKVLVAGFLVLLMGGAGAYVAMRQARPGALAVPQGHVPITETVVNARISIPAKSFIPYSFAISDTCKSARLDGNYQVEGGGTLGLLVLADKDFIAWKQRRPFAVVYGKTRSAGGTLNLQFPGSIGRYQIVMSNVTPAPQIVQADIKLHCMR